MCALLKIVPERQAYPRLFDTVMVLLEALENRQVWLPLFVRFELALLEEVGFGLDLSACAATGTRDDLTHVSPRSGRSTVRPRGACRTASPGTRSASRTPRPSRRRSGCRRRPELARGARKRRAGGVCLYEIPTTRTVVKLPKSWQRDTIRPVRFTQSRLTLPHSSALAFQKFYTRGCEAGGGGSRRTTPPRGTGAS